MAIAHVVKTKNDLALVKTASNKSPCSTCKSPCVQQNCSNSKNVTLWAKNSSLANIGDEVVVEPIKTNSELFYGFFSLMLPLILSIVSYLLSYGLGCKEGVALLIAFTIFIIFEILSVFLCKYYEQKHPTLNIVKTLEKQ